MSMLTGFDLDLARQVNQSANRIRGLYTQIHPALEAVLGPHLEHDAVLEAIAAWPTPTALRKAGKARIDARLKKHGARRHAAWAQQICDALDKQAVTVAGTEAAGRSCPTWPASSSPCTLRGPISPTVSRPWWRPTLFTRS